MLTNCTVGIFPSLEGVAWIFFSPFSPGLLLLVHAPEETVTSDFPEHDCYLLGLLEVFIVDPGIFVEAFVVDDLRHLDSRVNNPAIKMAQIEIGRAHV